VDRGVDVDVTCDDIDVVVYEVGLTCVDDDAVTVVGTGDGVCTVDDTNDVVGSTVVGTTNVVCAIDDTDEVVGKFP
jgi:hypothetical protein